MHDGVRSVAAAKQSLLALEVKKQLSQWSQLLTTPRDAPTFTEQSRGLCMLHCSISIIRRPQLNGRIASHRQ
jgi:hypothetical protein